AGLSHLAKLAGHEQASGEAREENQCCRESSTHDIFPSCRLGDVNTASAGALCLRARHRQDAVVEIGGNTIRVNGNREMKRPAEAAVAALDPVVLLAV